MSFERFGIHFQRNWTKYWPLSRGKYLGQRIFFRAYDLGIVKAKWHEFSPGLWMEIDPRDYAQQDILLNNTWEPESTAIVTKILGTGGVFVDVGANAGYFSLIASQIVGAHGAVLSFEPNGDMMQRLRANASRSGCVNIKTEQTACTDRDSTTTFFLGHQSNSGHASLFSDNAGSDKCITIRGAPLDAAIRKHGLTKVDLVKIDVEGAELLVLRGMRDILTVFRPAVILELDPPLMRAAGYDFGVVVAFLEEYRYVICHIAGPDFLARPE